MIFTPVRGLKSCIPSNKLQKIMHTPANVAGSVPEITHTITFIT